MLFDDRFVLNLSTAWQTETVIYMMVGATLIGLSYIQLLRGHVNVDLLPTFINSFIWVLKLSNLYFNSRSKISYAFLESHPYLFDFQFLWIFVLH